jgi:hypothetical protein
VLKMNDIDHDKIMRFIDSLSHEDCARLVRYAKIGNPIFRDDMPFYKYFKKRFKSFGGMTAEMSKKMGWKKWGDCRRWEDFE